MVDSNLRRCGKFAERLDDGGRGDPNRVSLWRNFRVSSARSFLVNTIHAGQCQVWCGRRTADINDQPMQSSRPDIGRAKFVQLPRTGNGEMSRRKVVFFLVGGQSIEPVSRKTISTPLVAMRVFAPILRAAGVPVTDAVQSRQNVFRHGRSRDNVLSSARESGFCPFQWRDSAARSGQFHIGHDAFDRWLRGHGMFNISSPNNFARFPCS